MVWRGLKGLGGMRIGIVQLLVGKDKAANLRRAVEKVNEAARNGAKLVVLPVYMSIYRTNGG